MKSKLSITVDSDLVEWLDSQIETKRFSSRSHGIEYCVNYVKELEREQP